MFKQRDIKEIEKRQCVHRKIEFYKCYYQIKEIHSENLLEFLFLFSNEKFHIHIYSLDATQQVGEWYCPINGNKVRI